MTMGSLVIRRAQCFRWSDWRSAVQCCPDSTGACDRHRRWSTSDDLNTAFDGISNYNLETHVDAGNSRRRPGVQMFGLPFVVWPGLVNPDWKDGMPLVEISVEMLIYVGLGLVMWAVFGRGLSCGRI